VKFPKRKWSAPKRGSKPECPEALLQKQAEEELQLRGIQYMRIDDGFWRWLHMAASQLSAGRHLRWFRWMFGGWPDLTCFIPIKGKPYSLCLHLELKTQDEKGRAVGRLHGRQKTQSRRLPWQVSRSSRQTDEILLEFIRFSEEVSEAINERCKTKGV
jgi:hypothetical protein